MEQPLAKHSYEYPYPYLFTVTFKSMTVAKKFQLINEFPNQIFYWGFGCVKRIPEMKLLYCIEYHKKKVGIKGKEVPETNNVTAPHLHGILYCKKPLSSVREDDIKSCIERYYGRTQFYLQEDQDEVQGYRDYCEKHVVVNTQRYNYQHKYEVMFHPKYLEKHNNTINDDFDPDDY